MRFAVMGAGSIGCYFGALLARAGEEVTLIGRKHHIDAINQRGLLLEIGQQSYAVPIKATVHANGVADADVVLVCVKSDDTEAAGRQVAPYLNDDAILLSLQNGVDNAQRLAAIVDRTVVPVAVYVATAMAGPGHVKHYGRGDLVIGACPKEKEITDRFGAAGIPVEVSASAIEALWAKLILNCAYNPLSALTRLPYGQMLSVTGMETLVRNIVEECCAVARAAGVAVPADILANVLALAATMPQQTSSTAQDLAAKRRTEIDHLNGFMVREGARLGIPTPVNQALHTLVKGAEIEARQVHR
ncbi:MAG: ketopantoate reductase family protein [Hyphomicrobiaceae bacterium]